MRIHRRRPTLRARLTLLFSAVFLLAGVLLVGVMYGLLEQRLGPSSSRVLQVRSERAPVTAGPDGLLPPPDQLAYTGQVVRAIDEYNDGTLRSLLVWSLLAIVVLMLAAAAAGWLVAGRALRPLQEITATARRVAEGSLDQRIALDGPRDELKELADTFDAMLERLHRAFTGQRRFVADASHELRTPLAVNRTLLEVALAGPDASPDLRSLGRTLLATNERSERLIEGLLTLAAGRNELTRRGPVDLADVAARAAEQGAREAAERDVALGTAIAPAPVSGDGVLLERLVQNLVENGLRHNAPGGRVDVVTRAGAGGAELVVTNTGPVVPPYETESLFEPFRRLAERTASDRGVGLGLAIARAIAEAHGGTLTATADPAGGLAVTLTLPPG